ncbi:hypothetical protein BBBOND_0300030 [Babesia bigemina]|uniref:C3H1-type domain-containing protein n=1 Tax=Babesia bigemina TaxID=5866 RepID=A0A061D6B6_BABBI|nr:hypothetical protein BBBOND_0300030 [Babesia bigemina]CDR96098.1 hypothetical protein BBBOND_0300030 [Babesia bigemina]|eukprot:XP_012768284.1 hypothetical protein BBBOND_0300030 [Babesia bigemina]
MGFLSGVLSNIKGHLGQHKGTLNDAIYTLNTNKHAGKKGFNAAIESVVAGVRGYNGNVKTSNDLVKTAIKKLQRDMKNYKKEELQTKLPNNINPKRPTASTQESVEKAMSLVEDCRKFAKDFITAVDIKTNKSETINAIKDLNPKLRDTIENVRKNLQHESKRLKELSSKESEKLKATEEKIKKALGDLKCNVNNRIDVQVNELVNHLRKLVKENILPKLQEVDTNLFKYVETLQEWITEADGILKIALEKVKKILQEVNWDDQTKFPRQIVQASDLMNILLQGNAEELQKWRDAAGSVVSAAKEKCKTIGGMVETGTAGSDKIHGLAKDMHDKAEKLRKAAQHIKDNIGTWVRTALTQVKDMDEALKGDLYKVKEAVDGQVTEIKTAIGKLYDKFDAYGRGLQNKEEDKKKVEEVIKHFKIQVAGIRGNAKGFRGSADGLAAIRKYVWEKYAEKFAGSKFEDEIVKGWIADIWDNNGMVKKWIKGYVEGNKHRRITGSVTYFKAEHIDNQNNIIQKNHTQKIAGIIMANLKDRISQATSNITAGEEQTSKMNLEYVRDMCTSFAQRIGEKIMESKFGSFASTIATEVDTTVRNEEVTSNDVDRVCLTNAVHAILAALYAKAKQAGDQLHKLLAECNLGYIDSAYNKATDFVEKLDKALNDTDGTNHAAAVDTAIDGVTSKLEEQLLKDAEKLASHVKLPTDDPKFQGYRGFVAQTEEALQSLKNGLKGTRDEGHLPAAIGEIKTNVTSKLTEKGLEAEINDRNTFTTPFDQITTKLKTIAGLVEKGKGTEATVPVGDADGIKNKLDALTTGLANGPLSTANGLQQIQESLKDLLTHTVPLVTLNLNELCNAVIDAAGHGRYQDGLNTKLSELKEMYFKQYKDGVTNAEKSINKIKDNLNKLRGPVTDALVAAKNFVEQDAADAEEHYTKELKKFINQDVEDAISSLTSHARQQYVDSIKLLLQAFAEKAQEELSPLPKLIDTDLTIGFKGFMKAVEGEVTEGETTGANIKKLSSLATDPVDSADKKTAFQNLSKNFKEFYINVHLYVKKEAVRLNEEENDKKHPAVKDVYDYHGQLIAIYDAFNELMAHIHRTHRYDHILPGMLDKVDAALSSLKPDGFAKPSSPVIDGLIAGLTHFIGEMRRVYISAYDSVTFGGELVRNLQSEKSELTKEGRNVAKAFLTLLATLFHDLDRLRGECRSLSKQKINQSTDLGRTMRGLGYSVSVDKQDGELQNKETVLGENVYKRILWPIKEADENEHLERCESRDHDRNDKFHLLDVLNCICSHVEEYNQVSHCATFAAKRQPCSVFEMLIWFAGLPYNNAYAELKSDGFTDLLDNPAKPLTDDDDIIVYDMDSFYIDACPRKFTYRNIRTVLHHICTKSYDILCAIGGHGDAGTIYGIDFCNNSFSMKYPQSGADCLQMFLDVLRRILPPLRYLFKRCGVKADQFGWSDCLYGRDIATGKSQCTEHSSDEPKCQPTSPLMSYLNDCLPGHLPHQVSAIGCKAECKTCPTSKPGMPCLTPLGFRGFSGSTRKGWDLYETLSYFFGTNLISSLLCVVTKPPSTLPEHFGFALSLVNKWHESGTHLIKDAFHSSTLSRSIGLYDQTATLTDALRNAYGSTQNGHPNREVKRADLSSLSTSTASAEQTAYTAPYLHSLCHDAYYYVAKKHVNAYLSWALYLPWDLHKYLENLHDALKNIFCRDWGCSTCLRADKCKRGEHGIIEGACKCSSVVSCKGILPTLYKYGFVFEDAKSLTASEKTCFAFIQQVQNVIRSAYFTELFDRCDEFIFTIRAPFLWMTVALWSLSLFYLLCVMVGRLDVLHIRSHLRIPSSHKITAQSLLAAAQVGRLAKISYLQP